MQTREIYAAFALSVSLFALVTVVLIGLPHGYGDHEPSTGSLVIGILFGSLCASGMVAALRPGYCFRFIVPGRSDRARDPASRGGTGKPTAILGHHPDHQKFSSHVFRLGDGVYCVGCTGLFTGGLLSLFGNLGYFFGGWDLPDGGLLTLNAGAIMVAVSLLQFALAGGNRTIRFAANTIFPPGAFLVLASVDSRSQDTGAVLFVLLVIVFWVLTKVLLSRWNHARIESISPSVP